VEIQQGCDHRCTFCIIPFGRGNNRSAPIGAIAEQIRTLVEAGYNEVVLTGVDIAGYGKDLPGAPSLGQLVRRLLAAVPELKRLRLSSLDPAVIDDDLLRAVAEEERLMPHLHLSLQAGDDLILKRMKRRHSRDDAVALTERLRALRPDIAFGADLIAGFPTESDEAFANTLALVEDCGLTYLHVFPYSERPGTPAARMPQLPKPVRKARAKSLRDAGEAALGRFLDTLGDERLKDPKFETPRSRFDHRAEFGEIVERIIRERTSDEWMDLFRENNVPVNRVAVLEEVIEDPQIRINEMVVPPVDPEVDVPLIINHPIKVDGVPQVGPKRGPDLAEHTDEILKELGYSDAQIQALRDEGAV